MIRALARGDDRAREQYLDIFSGRGFREAIVTHRRRAALIRRDIRRDVLEALHFVAPQNLIVTPPQDGAAERRIAQEDDAVQVDDEAAVQAVGGLIARTPRSSRLEDLAPSRDTDPALRERVANLLASLVAFGLCAISTEPVVCAARVAERPVALARRATRAQVSTP